MDASGSDAKDIRFKFDFTAGRSIRGLPSIAERKYGRIVVLLGINGSGKSRLLRALSVNAVVNDERRMVVFVEGGRALNLPENRPSFHVKSDYLHGDSFAKRLEQLFQFLGSEFHLNELAYREQVVSWVDGGQVGAKPIRKETALRRIDRIFTQLLPGRKIRVDHGSNDPIQDLIPKWCYTNGDAECLFASFSDGEKQVLSLLGDIGEMSPPNALVIVDEPELNLHPSLAMNLWNWIEDRRPDAVFVYATHSVSFAMRSNVTDIIVLGEPDQEPAHFDRLSDSVGIDWEPFLGAIPAFITSKQVLAVEGETTGSFDRAFYNWVLGPDVTVVNVGNCDDVKAAINHEGAWSKFGSVKICGVVDRDFKTLERLGVFSQRGCHVLALHEAESYLCLPSIIVDAASHTLAKTISTEEVIDRMVEVCNGLLTKVSLRRTSDRTAIRLAIGKAKGEWPKDFESAKIEITQWIESESPRVAAFESSVMCAFEEEFRLCKHAVDTRDVIQMLTLFPGKDLLKPLAKLAGLSDEAHLFRVVYRILSPDKYPELVEIGRAVRDKLT